MYVISIQAVNGNESNSIVWLKHSDFVKRIVVFSFITFGYIATNIELNNDATWYLI